MKIKNTKLRNVRDVSFEEVVIAFKTGGLIDEIANSSSNFPDQRAYVVGIGDYIYYISFVKKDKNTYCFENNYPQQENF